MSVMLADPDMRGLIDFYKCYRAFVRGKVNGIRASDSESAMDAQNHSAESARRHFRLALRYALRGSRPLLLVFMGRIASGKSTLAAALAEQMDCIAFSSDEVRKNLSGVPLHERGSSSARSTLYSPEMTRNTYERLFTLADGELQSGRDVILDATFSQRSWRDALSERFGDGPAQLRVVEVQARDHQVKERLAARETASGETSDARLEDFERLSKQYEPPIELSPARFISIQANDSVEQTCAAVLAKLAKLHVESTSVV
jgi:predicted kinase